MPLVQAKCENCAGILEVDSTKKAAICPYCGTPYVVQDAINNYITNIGTLHADVVNINDDKSAKARLDAAEAFMKLHKYREAWKAYEEVCSLTPQDYRGWWGKIRVRTEDFTLKIESKSKLEEIENLYQSALMFVPNHERAAIEQRFEAYYNPLAEDNTSRHEENNGRQEEYIKKCKVLNNKIEMLQNESANLVSSILELDKLKYPKVECFALYWWPFSFILLVLGFLLESYGLKGASLLGVLFMASSIWEFIIRPIMNAKTEFERRKTEKKQKRLRTQNVKTQEELQQAKEQLQYLQKQFHEEQQQFQRRYD